MPAAVFSAVPLGDGSFRAVPQTPVAVASITRAAKLTGLARDTIYRLFKADMITGRRASVGKIEIDLASLSAHIAASNAPDFWTKERRRRYMEASAT